MNADAKITVMSSREFNQDTARAKRAAREGPVFITDRGKPSHVLLTKEDFDRLEAGRDTRHKQHFNLAEALADPRPEADFDWEPSKMTGSSLKPADLG